MQFECRKISDGTQLSMEAAALRSLQDLGSKLQEANRIPCATARANRINDLGSRIVDELKLLTSTKTPDVDETK